ncbi:dTDP-4-amino-4,6-dideoxygalactose transaminase [Ferrimonas marina]|uniref:dTDP-4-amino-4,6-dideoxygalactose transaminase n=1 Tax=Ferrimonas marina TaxID=299255 RepID=A0A1M5VKR0_9GAMM|nr:dTDP-4-amino-4,6-dideoxygalactose transaminase [Ferrimonas marina]SHH75503.1 dTDP-4-amino-4,6-dideoxygalactose transaminase [Ferrimonas marina]
MIKFTQASVAGNELEYINDAISKRNLAGDGQYTKRCELLISELLESDSEVLLTPSCTAALEMSALLIGIKEGDEVIIPSYTFVSTANAFLMHGAKVVFVDVDPNTMNIDVELVEQAITNRTRAIVPVHYAGVSCDMGRLMDIAERHNIYVVEDAAQALMARYKGEPVGTKGHLSAFSFHSTKNYTSGGEGGCLVINDATFRDRAHVLREKGTNRRNFIEGTVDKYTWVDKGSSFLMSEIQAAFLLGQLESADKINIDRKSTWNFYFDNLSKENLPFSLPSYTPEIEHNGHMFFIKLEQPQERQLLIKYMKENGVETPFHYVPLHSSPAGLKYASFFGEDRFTTLESSKIVRLPLWFGMTDNEKQKVVETLKAYWL